MVDANTLQTYIRENVAQGAVLCTDEATGYQGIETTYGHYTVNHSAGEYVRGSVSTNSIESVWAVMKRCIHGVYQQVSKKHLARYVDEFTFRLNDGDVKRHTLQRLDSFVTATGCRIITYKELTA